MARLSLPKGRAGKAFVGMVAGTLAFTFGIVAKGIFADGDGEAAPPKAGSAQQAKPTTAVAKPVRTEELSSTPTEMMAAKDMQSVPAQGVKRILKIEGPLRHGAYVWDDKGVPPGPIIITVDLKAETLSVFRGGYEIGVAVIVYGATDKPSPVGTFPVTEKDADHVSNLYDAPMPYMLRLTDDGVAIHGSDVAWGNATHGCIGVPTPFARKLFGEVKLGDIVIITDGKMMDLG